MITHSTHEEVKRKVDCLIIPLWEGRNFERYISELNKHFDGVLENVLKSSDFDAKKLETSLIYSGDKKVPRIMLAGLGEYGDFSVLRWKQVVGAAVIAAQSKKMVKLGIVLPKAAAKKLGGNKLGKETTIAVDLANYSYDEHKSDEDARVKPLRSVKLIGDLTTASANALQRGIKIGRVIAEAVNYTRQLGNIPPTIMTPTYLAREAHKLDGHNRKVKVRTLNRADMKKLGMGCLLGVSRGSEEEPKFIILEYTGAAKSQKPIVLVGKGITFDSGGISLKPHDYLANMKFDMLGAAGVLGILKAVIQLRLKKNIVGLIPACENMPDGTSYRPDDILYAMNGKSVLIENTDAEGRLILADALSYAEKYKPKEVIDLATLTGACLVALGNERSGLFSTEDRIANRLLKCSENVGEGLWRLPLGEEYSEGIKAEVADITNVGLVDSPRHGGASLAAAFLQEFTSYPWAHIDLSCSYYGKKGKPWIRVGANGFGVQTLMEYLSS